MNYSEMSDPEINQAVTAIEYDCGKWCLTEDGSAFYHCGPDGSGYYEQKVIDYCNDPVAAWPIIVENKISITNELGEWVAMNEFRVNDGAAYCNNWETDSKPLRAAMIVFLMMNEADSGI